MAARSSGGGKSVSVAVEGLAELEKLPGWLDRGQKEFLEKGVRRLGEEVKRRAPGGPAGKAARDVEARVLSSTTAVIRSKGWVAAGILERGGVIRPKKPGGALRLHDGRFVRGSVFIRPRGYFRKGLRNRSKIIRGAYHEAFGDLKRPG